eukprot:6200667-Pleurochrysis_carterae.AAC.2
MMLPDCSLMRISLDALLWPVSDTRDHLAWKSDSTSMTIRWLSACSGALLGNSAVLRTAYCARAQLRCWGAWVASVACMHMSAC